MDYCINNKKLLHIYWTIAQRLMNIVSQSLQTPSPTLSTSSSCVWNEWDFVSHTFYTKNAVQPTLPTYIIIEYNHHESMREIRISTELTYLQISSDVWKFLSDLNHLPKTHIVCYAIIVYYGNTMMPIPAIEFGNQRQCGMVIIQSYYLIGTYLHTEWDPYIIMIDSSLCVLGIVLHMLLRCKLNQ